MAKGFRHISGVGPDERTPESLTFLIKQRSFALGQIKKLEAQIGDLPRKLEKAKELLAAIDLLLDQHDMKIDVSKIKPKRTYRRPLLPHGHLRRFLINTLKEAKGKPLPTTQITVGLMTAYGLTQNSDTTEEARYAVLKGLKNLKDNGVVTRHDSTGKHREGLWSLAVEVEQ